MGAPRFFVNEPLAPSSIGTEIMLSVPVAHHAVRVLRLAAGDVITLFDGSGGEYRATLTRADKRDAWARIDALVAADCETRLAVTLVQAVAASDTMDAVVRRAVELGVTAIRPVVSERGSRVPDGAQGAKRLAHWRQVAISACEQCGRSRVPDVHDAAPLADWLRSRSREDAGLVFDARSDATLASLPAPSDRLDILVGPEGGLTADEVDRALGAGMRSARLGPRVLRADTASLAALAAVNLLWGDFR
ncbi:MAG TPA: 16S rRNA (uracil(1498)-N(3))-methyltransferase [Casimicrobiaceae bacterium]|nr:16S rRNA (uracil(1498)-N(3))-methyltransferase [Casimicrobiaceae bacterium]